MTKDALLFLLIVFILPTILFGETFSSESYTIVGPTLAPGGYSTSTNFSLSGTLSEMAIGAASAAASNIFGGFLYFPYVSTPVVNATAGDAKVTLAWTAADTSTGYVVGSYAVGQATVAEGPYTYSNVGNVLSSERTGLANGTTYYFVVQVIDGVGSAIATSTEVSATPVAQSGGQSSGGGGGRSGGGGGGGGSTNNTGYEGLGRVVVSGRAYPRAVVTLLKDAQVAATTIADPLSNFSLSLNNLSAGNYFLSLYSEDAQGNRSSLLTFPVSVTESVVTNIAGVFIAPTTAVDKTQVKRGDDIQIFGQSTASTEVTIQVNSEEPHFAKAQSDALGAYLYNLDTAPLEYGDHSTKTKASKGGEISSYSAAVGFAVGDENIFTEKKTKAPVKGDASGDGRVNLVDFSVAAYWYNRPNPPKTADANGDGKVNLVDFSIMAYNWTG